MNTMLKLVTLTFVLFGISVPPRAQEPTAPDTFTSDRLEQMAAPIALYPDALVAQILMASTYPLEVVEASRWVEQNPDLQGPALEEALKLQEWDPSVKALCGFPTVLKLMNENLSWTRDLGDAFLAQQPELMDTIQAMRLKAYEAGNLETTEQQQVIREERTIVIQSANPEVIYVPYYEPVYVYGPYWHYPTWYYPGCYISPYRYNHVSFSIGFNWGCGLWGGFNWRDHGCHVDPHRFNHFNTRTCARPSHGNFFTGATRPVAWQHNPQHRGAVRYKSEQVARHFGGEARQDRANRGPREGKQSGFLGGAHRESKKEERALPRSSDSASRASAPKTDRSRSGAFERKQDAGPAASRKPREQAVSPSSPSRRSDSGGAGRKDGGVINNGRSGRLFDAGAAKAGARSGGSTSGGRIGGAVSGGRSGKSSGGGAVQGATRSGGTSSGGRSAGAAIGNARGGKSFSDGAARSRARSGSSGSGSSRDKDR